MPFGERQGGEDRGEEEVSPLRKGLASLYTTGHYSDITLHLPSNGKLPPQTKVQTRDLHLHRLVLSTQSTYFDTLLSPSSLDTTSIDLSSLGTDPAATELVLRYLYTARYPAETQGNEEKEERGANALERHAHVFRAAVRLGVPPLQKAALAAFEAAAAEPRSLSEFAGAVGVAYEDAGADTDAEAAPLRHALVQHGAARVSALVRAEGFDKMMGVGGGAFAKDLVVAMAEGVGVGEAKHHQLERDAATGIAPIQQEKRKDSVHASPPPPVHTEIKAPSPRRWQPYTWVETPVIATTAASGGLAPSPPAAVAPSPGPPYCDIDDDLEAEAATMASAKADATAQPKRASAPAVLDLADADVSAVVSPVSSPLALERADEYADACASPRLTTAPDGVPEEAAAAETYVDAEEPGPDEIVAPEEPVDASNAYYWGSDRGWEKPLELEPEPALEPVIEPAPEPVIEPAPEPVIEPAPEPVIEPAPEPVIEPAPEPALEPAPDPVAEPVVVEPAPEAAPDDFWDSWSTSTAWKKAKKNKKKACRDPFEEEISAPAPAPEPELILTPLPYPDPLEQILEPKPEPEPELKHEHEKVPKPTDSENEDGAAAAAAAVFAGKKNRRRKRVVAHVEPPME